MRLRRLIGTLLVVTMPSVLMAAEENEGVTVERFRPLVSPDAMGGVDSAEIPGHLEWDVGGFADYAQNLFIRVNAVDRRQRIGVVGHRFGGEGGAYLGLFGYVSIGMNAPASLLQLRTDGSLLPARDTLSQLMPVVMGDVRPQIKARLLRQDVHFVSLALSADLTIPTSLGLAYGGERVPTFSPQLMLSRTMFGVNLMGNAGLRFRGERIVGRQSITDEIFYRAGAGYDFGHFFPRIRVMPYVEFAGHTSLVNPLGLGLPRGDGRGLSALAQNGFETGAGVRWEIVDGVQLVGGMAAGVLPSFGTPDYRVYTGVRLARRIRDKDGDGIDDPQDRCVDKKEDRDGFQDSDGCPDPDNDHDGIPDAADRCPDLAEDVDGFADDDGCPDPDNDQDGVPDAQDSCPLEAGDAAMAGCPLRDGDGDGIPDASDACPTEAEDRDGFEDDDGCPDLDNDNDGITDGLDGCPFEPEDPDGFEDEDGCPDPDDDKDGIPDTLDECPRRAAPPERVALGQGCPDEDQDGDGVMDSVDQCPADAEDKDGFQDGDGCPDKDNDRDGVLDDVDKCPAEAEVINGFKDEDGCPDEGPAPLVKITPQKLEIAEKVFFDSGRATIQKRSNNLLNQVALTLIANPQIERVAVEGHTDNQGRKQKNLVLSQKRAEAVRNYLVKAGVAPSRLRAVGYGQERPTADNKKAAGRERNRRVEFVIEKLTQ